MTQRSFLKRPFGKIAVNVMTVKNTMTVKKTTLKVFLYSALLDALLSEMIRKGKN